MASEGGTRWPARPPPVTNSCTRTVLIPFSELDPKAMRLIPVIDLLAGHVVHACAGQRTHYRPIVSLLHPGSDPKELACVLRDLVGNANLYVADLDSIAGRGTHAGSISQLVADGGRVHLDPGIRQAEEIPSWLALGVTRVILGTESLKGPEVLGQAVASAGPSRLAIGLDLRGSRPILAAGSESAWGQVGHSPLELLRLAAGVGIPMAVVVELESVGTGGGLAGWAVPLARQCRDQFPELELWIGGGLAGEEELPALAEAGIAGVLVATALHQRKLSQGSLNCWSGR